MAEAGDPTALRALRLDLANQGLRIGDGLREAGFALALAGESPRGAEGIDLVLPGGLWVNVPVAPAWAATSPWTLDGSGPGDLALERRGRAPLAVRLPDTVRFRHARTRAGIACGDIGAVHDRWLVMAPIAPAEGIGLDRPRRFLGLPPLPPLAKRRWSVDEVVACAESAWRLAGVRLVHLEASWLLAEDGGVAELAPYLAALRRALGALVSVSVLPPADPAAVLDLYAAGCDAVAYHLLAWDEADAARVAPLRARFVPHQRIRAALHAAAAIFPRGAVASDLLVGLEPLDHLPAALAALCAAGVVPNLTVFRPLPGAEGDAPPGELVPTERVLALMAERVALLRRHRLLDSPVRGFPRALAGAAPYRPGWRQRAYAGLRRWARVRREEPP